METVLPRVLPAVTLLHRILGLILLMGPLLGAGLTGFQQFLIGLLSQQHELRK